MIAECEACGRGFEAQRSSARWCGQTCRKRGTRSGNARVRGDAAVKAVGARRVKVDPLVAATRRELDGSGVLDTAAGQQALRLAERMAERMAGKSDTGSAIAALSRELRAVMAEALADAHGAGDSLDELASRRALKAAGA